jgi:hypothetical protein
LKIRYIFDLNNRIKIATIYKNFFFSNHDFYGNGFLQFCGKQKGTGARAAILNLGSSSRRQFNFGSSVLGSGSTTLI